MWGQTFRRINNRSLSLRPFGLFAILTDRTGWSLAPATPTMTFYVPARRHQVTPVPVGYATAPNQELRRRDFHPLVQQPDSLHACLLAEPPKAALRHQSASVHFVTSTNRSGCYQPKRQLLSGIRTHKNDAPFHGALPLLGLGHRSCGSSRASACSRVRSSGGTSFEGHPLLEGTPAPGDLAAWPWIDFDPPALDRLLERLFRDTGRRAATVLRAAEFKMRWTSPSIPDIVIMKQWCRTLKRLAADVVVRPVLDAGLREPEPALYSQIRTF